MLHPQARALLDLIEARGVPATHTLTPAEARSVYRERRHFTQPAPADVDAVRDLQAEGPHGAIALRLYRPLGAGQGALPVLVYYHGGGWVIGDLDTHDSLCRDLANASGCAVIAVDYRMGPEHRFPAAVDDALAAVVALAARDAGDLPIAFQLLIYPATDMRRGHASHSVNGEGYLLTRDTISYFHDHYIDAPAHDLDWRASPLLASDFAGLPPALVITAGHDPLRDEGADYARALTEAGNRVSYVCFERQIHGFVTMGRVLDEARTAIALCGAELRRVL